MNLKQKRVHALVAKALAATLSIACAACSAQAGAYPAKPVKLVVGFAAGTAGMGSSGHFATEMFARANGLQINHVPYKGAAPVVTDLMGGQLDSSFATLGSVLPQIRSGQLTALAVASPRRSALLADVSTFAQAGGGDYSADAWYGVLAPAGLPEPIAQQLEKVAREFAGSPAAIQKLRGLGLEPDSTCGKAFATQVEREVTTYTQIARDLDLKAD